MSTLEGVANNLGAGQSDALDRRDTTALKKIRESNPTLYVDVAGTPIIGLPLGGRAEEQVLHRLRSRRVRAELFKFILDNAHFLPFEQEINRVLWYLEAKAWEDCRIDVDYGVAVDLHPLVEAVHIFLYDFKLDAVYRGKASELLGELEDLAHSNGIDIEQPAWPKGANSLSEALWNFRETLDKGGIGFERGRSHGARHVTLRRIQVLVDVDESSSPHRPPTNSQSSTDLVEVDDDDDDEVLKRIATTSGAPNHGSDTRTESTELAAPEVVRDPSQR